jgi:dolichol-phosphate mannosyltransferase
MPLNPSGDEPPLPNHEVFLLECFLFVFEPIEHFLKASIMHWIKFNVVGVLGFALQVGALFVLTHTSHSISYLTATVLAVELAVLNNFVWHQLWTWRDRPTVTVAETLRRLAKFNITTGLVSILGNLVFMSLLVGRLGVAVIFSNLISVLACSLLNFILADRIAFHSTNLDA